MLPDRPVNVPVNHVDDAVVSIVVSADIAYSEALLTSFNLNWKVIIMAIYLTCLLSAEVSQPQN